MRKQAAILADIDRAHKQYFTHLRDHAASMQILFRLRALEQELIEAAGDKYDAYHLEHLSYMAAYDEYEARPRNTYMKENIARE
jgi:hypothetical protein